VLFRSPAAVPPPPRLKPPSPPSPPSPPPPPGPNLHSPLPQESSGDPHDPNPSLQPNAPANRTLDSKLARTPLPAGRERGSDLRNHFCAICFWRADRLSCPPSFGFCWRPVVVLVLRPDTWLLGSDIYTPSALGSSDKPGLDILDGGMADIAFFGFCRRLLSLHGI